MAINMTAKMACPKPLLWGMSRLDFAFHFFFLVMRGSIPRNTKKGGEAGAGLDTPTPLKSIAYSVIWCCLAFSVTAIVFLVNPTPRDRSHFSV